MVSIIDRSVLGGKQTDRRSIAALPAFRLTGAEAFLYPASGFLPAFADALHTTLHPEKVNKLVMFGAIYGKNPHYVKALGDPTNPDRPHYEMGAYRYLSRKQILDGWDSWVKPELRDVWREKDVSDGWSG